MADIASIVPDTGSAPVSQNAVQPLAQQNGHQLPGQLPFNGLGSSPVTPGLDPPPNGVLLNGKVRSDSDEKEFASSTTKGRGSPNVEGSVKDPVNSQGVVGTSTGEEQKPVKGPRGGVHWGAGQSPLTVSCTIWQFTVVCVQVRSPQANILNNLCAYCNHLLSYSMQVSAASRHSLCCACSVPERYKLDINSSSIACGSQAFVSDTVQRIPTILDHAWSKCLEQLPGHT